MGIRSAIRWAMFVVSGLAVLTVVLWRASTWLNMYEPDKYRLSFGSEFHVGVHLRHPWDCRIEFFNLDYGPWHGGTIALLDAQGRQLGVPTVEENGFGDAWGVYYRYYRWITDETLWTLAISLWYP